jgi:hypothetical protein
MTTANVLRFSAKNGRSLEASQPQKDTLFALSDSRSIAWRIALDTISQLIELELLSTDSAPLHLAAYRTYLTDSSESLSILHFVFRLESELAEAQKRLATPASAPVWEIVKQILPPTQFYKAQPAIADACRQCGSVVLDAMVPATVTTASVNPNAGRILAAWIRSELLQIKGDERSPFCFHVTVPPQQWPAIARTHFGAEARCLLN